MNERPFRLLGIMWGGSLVGFIKNGEKGDIEAIGIVLRELLAKGYSELEICAADAVVSDEVTR